MSRAELRAEIVRKNVTNRELAKDLGISEQAFYNKIKGVSEFKESEIKRIAFVLCLSPERVNDIFFTQ